MEEVLSRIKPHLTTRHLLITIAAGLDSSWYLRHLNRLPTLRLIRVMPNLCLTVGEGASGLFATSGANQNDRTMATRLFSSSGKTVWLEDESLLDAVTALSGSGPAFVFSFLEALLKAGIAVGLSPEISRQLSFQTVRGALRLAETEKDLTDLIARVASKGGTTEAGLQVLESEGFSKTIQKTIEAAAARARELKSVK